MPWSDWRNAQAHLVLRVQAWQACLKEMGEGRTHCAGDAVSCWHVPKPWFARGCCWLGPLRVWWHWGRPRQWKWSHRSGCDLPGLTFSSCLCLPLCPPLQLPLSREVCPHNTRPGNAKLAPPCKVYCAGDCSSDRLLCIAACVQFAAQWKRRSCWGSFSHTGGAATTSPPA